MIFYEKNIFERHGMLLGHFFEVNICTATTNIYPDTNKNEFKFIFLKGKDTMFLRWIMKDSHTPLHEEN